MSAKFGAGAGRQTVVLLLWLLSALAMLYYLEAIAYPYMRSEMRSTGLAPGNGVGLYSPWLATREFLLRGRNPYGAEVTREIQRGVYGRDLESEDRLAGSVTRDEHRFAYPLYIVFLLAPTVPFSFFAVQVGGAVLLLLLTSASIRWWMDALGITAGRSAVLMVTVAVLGSFAVVQGILLQQVGLLVAAMLAGAAAAIARGRLGWAGTLLALALVKPHIALPLVGWFLLWSLGRWQQRQKLFWSFLLAYGALLGTSLALMPDWPARWLEVATRYPGYTGAKPVLAYLLGPAAPVAAVVLMLAVAALGWKYRQVEPRSRAFSTLTAVVVSTQVVILPTWIGHNQILLLAAVLLFWFTRQENEGLVFRLALGWTILLVLWERLAAVALDVAAVFASAAAVQKAAVVSLPLVPGLLFPASLFVLAVMAARLHLLPPRQGQSSTK